MVKELQGVLGRRECGEKEMGLREVEVVLRERGEIKVQLSTHAAFVLKTPAFADDQHQLRKQQYKTTAGKPLIKTTNANI
jgi:hypothetical protein